MFTIYSEHIHYLPATKTRNGCVECIGRGIVPCISNHPLGLVAFMPEGNILQQPHCSKKTLPRPMLVYKSTIALPMHPTNRHAQSTSTAIDTPTFYGAEDLHFTAFHRFCSCPMSEAYLCHPRDDYLGHSASTLELSAMSLVFGAAGESLPITSFST